MCLGSSRGAAWSPGLTTWCWPPNSALKVKKIVHQFLLTTRSSSWVTNYFLQGTRAPAPPTALCQCCWQCIILASSFINHLFHLGHLCIGNSTSWMQSVLNLTVLITGIKPLAIIKCNTAIESGGCPRLCPYSLSISIPQYEIYGLHILPLNIRNKQSGLGWDLLFQTVNIRSSHLVTYILPSLLLSMSAQVPIAHGGDWVWSLQQRKSYPTKPEAMHITQELKLHPRH